MLQVDPTGFAHTHICPMVRELSPYVNISKFKVEGVGNGSWQTGHKFIIILASQTALISDLSGNTMDRSKSLISKLNNPS